MALFNFGKKKEQSCCCCGFDAETKIAGPTVEKGNDELKSIKVLGAGCGSCHEQLKFAKEAVKNMGLDIEVEYLSCSALVPWCLPRLPLLWRPLETLRNTVFSSVRVML